MPRRTQVAPRLREGYQVACTDARGCGWRGWRRAESRGQAQAEVCPQSADPVHVVHYSWRPKKER